MILSERIPKLSAPNRRRLGLWALWIAVAVQTLSALIFVVELWSEILGLRDFVIGWAWVEAIQVLASIGLLSGAAVSALFLRRHLREMAQLRQQVDVVSGQFAGHLERMFREWELSPSEAQIAVYAMKGFSNAEIADLRGTSVATVKSQMSAVYRKTGHSGRQQLVSMLVEDLLAGVPVPTETDREGAQASKVGSCRVA